MCIGWVHIHGLTVLGLPPGFETVRSKPCHHILNSVAGGTGELIVLSSGIAFETFIVLLIDRERRMQMLDESVRNVLYSLLGIGKVHSCSRTPDVLDMHLFFSH